MCAFLYLANGAAIRLCDWSEGCCRLVDTARWHQVDLVADTWGLFSSAVSCWFLWPYGIVRLDGWAHVRKSVLDL